MRTWWRGSYRKISRGEFEFCLVAGSWVVGLVLFTRFLFWLA